MKNISNISTLLLFLASQSMAVAQCGSAIANGSSSNMFTQIRNGTNPVAADKNLNTIVFAHRNNATAFGGNSGQLRYDVSTNAGLTWTSDLGVLNPVNTSLARYPNVAIYNPTLNTTPANAYLGYMGATINGASAWNGVVTGVRQLGGAGNTENYNQPSPPSSLIAHSLVKGAPGVFWAADAQYNGTYITGFNIYKGTWNGGTNDIAWSNNTSLSPPFNTIYSGFANVGDYNIAFDPTGTKGWFSFLGHLNTGPTSYAFYPVLYKTTNGGATWTGPIQVDLNQFSCLTSNITAGNVVSANFEHDLVVDVNGNPHFLTTVCNGSASYSIYYTSWHHMVDVTAVNGVWTAYDLGNVNAGRGSWGTSPNTATQDMAPQAARSADGTKLFFTWSDNASYTLGAANQTPNFFGKGFNVITQKWTLVKDFTSCNAPLSGNIIFPHVAEEVLEPVLNTYKLAPVYGAYSAGNDPLLVSNFKFLDNITFANSDFTISQPAATISIAQGTNVIVCATGSVNLSLSTVPEGVLWSNGWDQPVNPVSTPGQYIVTAMQGCNIGMDTIMVTALSSTFIASNLVICPGDSAYFSASGNATSYSWTPGALGGSSVAVSPGVTTNYTFSAYGDQGCSNTSTVNVTVQPTPTLTVSGSNTVCSGSPVTQNVSGASTYTWPGSFGGASVAITPTATSIYTVTGTSSLGCVSSATFNIYVKPIPNIQASSSKTLICMGQTLSLNGGGASSYTLSGPSLVFTQSSSSPNTNITVNVIVSPTATAIYTVTGSNADGCVNRAMLTVSVSACTGLAELNLKPEISLYPNPNNGEFIISVNVDLDLQIVNELGQTVRNITYEQLNEHKISVSGLANGIYFIKGSGREQSVSQKMIVQQKN